MTTELALSRSDIEQLPSFRQVSNKECSSGCPRCGGTKRFRYWPNDGNFWCRECELKGFVSKTSDLLFTPEQYEAWKRAETERQAKERQQQASIIKRLTETSRAELYHHQMLDRSYWYGQGLTDETINKFKLGYSPTCPTCPVSPSWTIPIYYKGQLFNIRHRLAQPDKGGKYRPEVAGLPAAIFNADALTSGDWMIVLVEGEVKAMVLQQYGFSTIGIPGANSFKEKWVKLFPTASTIYVALDPGAESQAEEIAQTLTGNGIEARACSLPVKPDDMLVKFGGTTSDLCKFLSLGKKVK